MKILKSRYHNSQWNNIKVISLRVSDLWASVPLAKQHRGKEFYEPIKEDIRKNGLNFPLIVVDATRNDILKQKRKYKDKLCPLPFDKDKDDLNVRQYTVWGGSNRWNIANELKYDFVDCVIVENADFDKARSMQALHRRPYGGIYY